MRLYDFRGSEYRIKTDGLLYIEVLFKKGEIIKDEDMVIIENRNRAVRYLVHSIKILKYKLKAYLLFIKFENG